MVVVEPSGARFSDFSGNELAKTPEHITWNPMMLAKRGVKHFMLKEVFEQPQVIRDTLQGRISLDTGKVFFDEVELPSNRMEEIKKVVIIACGTSYHAGLLGKYFSISGDTILIS